MTAAASIKKSWHQRKKGIMKKADELRVKFNARVAVLIEKDGVLYAYMSDNDFPAALPGRLLESNKATPEDYMTVRQTQRNISAGASSTAHSDGTTAAGADEVMEDITPRPLAQPMRRTYFDSLDVAVDDYLFDPSM